MVEKQLVQPARVKVGQRDRRALCNLLLEARRRLPDVWRPQPGGDLIAGGKGVGEARKSAEGRNVREEIRRRNDELLLVDTVQAFRIEHQIGRKTVVENSRSNAQDPTSPAPFASGAAPRQAPGAGQNPNDRECRSEFPSAGRHSTSCRGGVCSTASCAKRPTSSRLTVPNFCPVTIRNWLAPFAWHAVPPTAVQNSRALSADW